MYAFSFWSTSLNVFNSMRFRWKHVSGDGRPKLIELYGVFKRKRINVDTALVGKTKTLHVHHTVVHFFAVFAGLPGENAYFLNFFFWTWIGILGIQLQEDSPTFDEVKG